MRSNLCFDSCFAQRATVLQRRDKQFECANNRTLLKWYRAEARRQQQGFVEEQHATALRVLDSHLPRPSSARNPNPVKSRSHAEHLKSKAIDADDAWLAQLDPAVQSLLIRKHPLHLTTLDRAEARCSLLVTSLPCTHLNYNMAPGACKLLSCLISVMSPECSQR